MKRWIAVLLVFVLFVVGVAVGALGMHLFDASALHRAARGVAPDPRGFAGRLERALDLSVEQRERIDEILMNSHIEADALHQELLPRVREHMDRTREKIRVVLTPEQQAAFDELEQRHRRWSDIAADFQQPSRSLPPGA